MAIGRKKAALQSFPKLKKIQDLMVQKVFHQHSVTKRMLSNELPKKLWFFKASLLAKRKLMSIAEFFSQVTESISRLAHNIATKTTNL